eukprot:3443905-Rhodomonas_salina.1
MRKTHTLPDHSESAHSTRTPTIAVPFFNPASFQEEAGYISLSYLQHPPGRSKNQRSMCPLDRGLASDSGPGLDIGRTG